MSTLKILISMQARGWFIRNATDILWYSSNEIAHRVKTQARSQNNRSRALKWGIVCLYSSSSFGDTTKYMKIWVLQFFHFCKKVAKSLYEITKLRKFRKMTLISFWSYLSKYLSYKDVQCLILKLLTYCFDLQLEIWQ